MGSGSGGIGEFLGNITEELKRGNETGGKMLDTLTGETAKGMAKEAKADALANEAKQTAKIAAQDEKMRLQQEFSKKRTRQKSLMGGNSGRSSTILTSPLGVPPSGAATGGKTALGQ